MLRGERVVLHPLLAKHADVLFPILSDAELWRYAPWPQSKSLEQLRARFARLESRRSSDDREYWLNWAVEENASGNTLGFVQATVDDALREANVAYVMSRAFWGRGLATDAVHTMLVHLKNTGVRAFSATVDSRNSRSVRLLERFAFGAIDAQDAQNVRYHLAASALLTIREELRDDAGAISDVQRAAFAGDAGDSLGRDLESGLVVASVVAEADRKVAGSIVR